MYAHERRMEEDEMMDEGYMEESERLSVSEMRDSYAEYLRDLDCISTMIMLTKERYDMGQHLGDFPTYEQMQEHNRLLGLIAGKDASASVLDSIIPAAINGENTTRLFWTWYAQAQDGSQDRYALLDRFFKGAALGWADKTYTLQSYADTVSTSSEMTPLDDLEGKTPGLLCTEASSSYNRVITSIM